MTDRPGRRRRRATAPQGAPRPAASQEASDSAPSRDEPAGQADVSAPSAETAPVADPPSEERTPRGDRRPRSSREKRVPREERVLRDVVGSGHSQLGVSGALRARDVNRPSEAELRAAEDEVVIVRRHWSPEPEHGRKPSR